MSTEATHTSQSLPAGTVLKDNYIVDAYLGAGGFGITYAGTCRSTGDAIAIKEYFPAGLANREYVDGRARVSCFEGQADRSFQKGRRRFLHEAEILRQFQELPSIVSVLDVFEENGTAYLVLEHIEGITLKRYIAENGVLSMEALLLLFSPVIHALSRVHSAGLVHRDISPDNLMIGLDNRLHLIDFGAASYENLNESKTMTIILKSGYAPPEQYLTDGRVGSWTDVYGMCATLYYALTGSTPPESIRRIQNDTLPPLAGRAAILPWQAQAIHRGMSLQIAGRYKNMEQLYQALTTAPDLEEMDTIRPEPPSAAQEQAIRSVNGSWQEHPAGNTDAPSQLDGRDTADESQAQGFRPSSQQDRDASGESQKLRTSSRQDRDASRETQELRTSSRQDRKDTAGDTQNLLTSSSRKGRLTSAFLAAAGCTGLLLLGAYGYLPYWPDSLSLKEHSTPAALVSGQDPASADDDSTADNTQDTGNAASGQNPISAFDNSTADTVQNTGNTAAGTAQQADGSPADNVENTDRSLAGNTQNAGGSSAGNTQNAGGSPTGNTQNADGSSTGNTQNADSSLTGSPQTDSILTMINLTGYTLDAATNILAQMDPSIRIQTTEAYSGAYASGRVISQSIRDHTQFTRGGIDNITLTISKGAAPSARTGTQTGSNKKADTGKDQDYNVKGIKETDDGYTTLHLD